MIDSGAFWKLDPDPDPKPYENSNPGFKQIFSDPQH
jgi:hypothetical protein